MRFLSSHELNKNKWDTLVTQAGGMYFSSSSFLDAMAKNWGAFVDENYSKGFAVCFNRVMGFRLLYPPLFSRTVEFFNLSPDDFNVLPERLKSVFKTGFLQSENELFLDNKSQKTYQVHDPSKAMNTLAKRMLKKACEKTYTVEIHDFRPILPFIRQELSGKVKELNTENLKRLETLLFRLEEREKLLSYGIFNSRTELCGGMFFAQNEGKTVYILGSATKSCRDEGGMYLCMERAIHESLERSSQLDFGGSNIESIRRFYVALGGVDRLYFSYSWDKSPFWFRLLRSLKKKL